MRDDLLIARAAGARSEIQLPVESMTVELTVAAIREVNGKAGGSRCRSWRWELDGASAGTVDCVSFGKAAPLLVEQLGGCRTPTARQVSGGEPPPQLLGRPGQPPSISRCYQFAIHSRIVQTRTIASGKANTA